jgi:serine/threonine protein kinase
MNNRFAFLIKHHTRAHHNGKWVIILDHVPGITLKEFITRNYKTDISKVNEGVAEFARTIDTWHRSGFAHGDPHTDNALIDPETMRVVLIDYSQIHHPEFHYCKEYGCFDPDPLRRVREDIANEEANLGDGFRTHLGYLQDEHNLGTHLTDIFDNHYTFGSNQEI